VGELVMIENAHGIYVEEGSKLIGKTVGEIEKKFKINILYVGSRRKGFVWNFEKRKPRKTKKIKVDAELEVKGKMTRIRALEKTCAGKRYEFLYR